MMIRICGTTLTALLFVACGLEKNDSDSDTDDGPTSGATSSGEGGSDSTVGAPNDPTTTVDAMTSTPLTMTSGEEPEPATSGETTTGGDIPGSVCADHCATMGACFGETPAEIAACTSDCNQGLEELEEPCHSATVAAMACQATLTCQQIDEIEEGVEGPCLDEMMAQQEVCGFGNECGFGSGGDFEGTECFYMRQCGGEPKLEMKCTTEVCECFSDDVKFGECAPQDACAALEILHEKALSCCGIEGEGVP
ncbi:hypothetical protein [Nannocystis sp. SCPEA4]|uniref:hypothetical protein n=1 Tax=Nannocystis sp. SCPEA4 TaxID=2996787 RepID=UPI00226D71FB|nr:hypothetical protein [Nannocystis sp. SCPEA4]MCY1058823.1 hypothetical protein [Nannocystis sp. SCPEA4]